jgi:folate-binding protein YgfZ
MLKPEESATRQTRLADMGAVRVQGPDAIKFLQGQLSNDVARLAADKSVLAGLHNPQGRAIALLRLVLAGPEEILAIVPRELAASVAARLAKFVLRAKVKITDVSSEWDVAGVQLDGIAEGAADASVGAARRDEDGRLWVCVDGARAARATSRWLVAGGATAQQAEPRGPKADASLHVGSPTPSPSRDEWHALDIAAGLPQVYAATTEAFVAQMLNLDLIDGIAFDKGCYTGQEVIARAHYRGKVKRRMQRFRTREPAKLAPGDAGTLGDGRTFKVVDAVQLSDGRCEFLGVTTVDAGEEAGEAAVSAPAVAAASGADSAAVGAPDASDSGSAAVGAGIAKPSMPLSSASEHPLVQAEQLDLPYSLPA